MNSKIYSLQYLRAFAALWVLFTHVLQGLSLRPGGMFFAGQWGVDIFFLLSGFIIYLTTPDFSSWKSFAIKRLFRIYPAYWVTLLIYTIYSIAIMGGVYNALTIFQNVIMVPFSGPLSYKSLIVGQAWSTCYELYFYFLMTFILMIRTPKKWILPIILILLTSSFVLRKYIPHNNGISNFLFSIMGSSHVLFFCEGIVISMLAERIEKLKIYRMNCVLIVIMSLMIYSVVLCTKYSFLVSFIISPLLFIIIYKANDIIVPSGVVHWSFLMLGDASFSIYLVHSVVINFLLNQCHIANLASLLLLTLFITIVLSILCFHFIEKKLIAVGKNLSLKFAFYH